MNLKIFNIAILCFSFFVAGAQTNCNPGISLNLSTGLNANLTNINNGELDFYWKLILIPPLEGGVLPHSSIIIPKLYKVAPYANSLTWNNTGAGILSPKNTALFDENNAFPTQPWKSRRYFCISNQGQYKIEGQFRCDDSGSISLHKTDGTQLKIENTQTNGFGQNTQVNWLISLAKGSYYLETKTLNTGATAMGFSFKGSMTAQNSSIINPQNNESCCPVGSINIQKIIDKNCNGKYDKGDELGMGFSFEIYKAGLQLGTITTNQLGEATLGGLTSGNYEIKEVAQNGTYPYQSNYNQNTILSINDNKQVTFFNCVGSPPAYYDPCCPPINKEDIKQMFNPVFQNGASGPYKMIFNPTQQFKNLMQAYINLLNLTCSSKNLNFAWQLCDMGNGNQPGSGYCNNAIEQKYTSVTVGGNGSFVPSTNFFNSPNSICQPNRWYRITLGIYPDTDKKCFDLKCSDSLVMDFRWQMMTGKTNQQPLLEILGHNSIPIKSSN